MEKQRKCNTETAGGVCIAENIRRWYNAKTKGARLKVMTAFSYTNKYNNIDEEEKLSI